MWRKGYLLGNRGRLEIVSRAGGYDKERYKCRKHSDKMAHGSAVTSRSAALCQAPGRGWAEALPWKGAAVHLCFCLHHRLPEAPRNPRSLALSRPSSGHCVMLRSLIRMMACPAPPVTAGSLLRVMTPSPLHGVLACVFVVLRGHRGKGSLGAMPRGIEARMFQVEKICAPGGDSSEIRPHHGVSAAGSLGQATVGPPASLLGSGPPSHVHAPWAVVSVLARTLHMRKLDVGRLGDELVLLPAVRPPTPTPPPPEHSLAVTAQGEGPAGPGDALLVA
ncbi:hypothetical protein VULLAG_LOCUS394 [Vulpes lagopus]